MSDLLKLEPYQEEGVEFLASRRHAMLGDEMRLGKTPQSIAAVDQVGAKTVIVVTVAVGVFNWQRQFEQWSVFDRDIHVVTTGRQATPQSGVIILSFDQAKAHAARLPAADVLIVDECHFVKSATAARTTALLGKQGVIHRAKRTWFLSGTPLPNGDPRELWTILFTCGVTRLTYDEFQDRYCEGWTGPYGFTISGLRNVDELQRALKPFMLRRMWKDVMSQLPELTFQNITVPPADVDTLVWFPEWEHKKEALQEEICKERQVLNALHEVICEGRSNARAQSFSGGLEQLATTMVTLRRYTALQKVPAVVEMVTRELERGAYEKLVIFCVHRDPIEFLRRELSKYGAVTLYGGTSPEGRRRNVEKFHSNPKCRVFIGQVLASGTNVDLSCASDILMVEQDWTPGVNAQAVMRCHNIKQHKNVHVRIIGLANDVDERVQTTIRRKTQQLATMFDKNPAE